MGKKLRKKKDRKAAEKKPVTFDLTLEELKTALQECRGHRALAYAKLLIKYPQFEVSAHLPLIAGAYGLRIRELLAKGQRSDSKYQLDFFLSRWPQGKGALDLDLLIQCDIELATDHVLPRYEKDPKVAEAVDGFIRKKLAAVDALAVYPHWPQTHPFRQQAAVIMEALESVSSGKGEGRTARIDRHSPFVGWRLFIQALSAYYAFNDDMARKCLSRLSAFPAVNSAGAILADLMEGVLPASPSGRRISSLSTGNSLHDQLLRIDGLLDQKRFKEVDPLMEGLLSHPYLKDKPGLRKEIGACCLVRSLLDPDSPYCDCGCCERRPVWIQRVKDQRDIVWHYMVISKSVDLEMWESHLDRNRRSLQPIEKALIYDCMAELAMKRSRDLDVFPDLFFFRRRRRGQEDAASDYFERSTDAYPLLETYRKWCDHMGNGDKRSESVLEKWHQDFPKDPTPLLALVDSCRGRGVYQKAMSYLNRIDRLEVTVPQVETKRHLLMIDNAIRQVAAGRPFKALDLLKNIPEKAEDCVPVVRAALKWHLQDKWPAAGGEASDALTALGRPLSLLWVGSRLEEEGIALHKRFLSIFPLSSAPANQIVNDLAALVNTQDAFWRPGHTWFRRFDLDTAMQKTTVESAILFDCMKRLWAGDESGTFVAPPSFFWPLTATGIARRDRMTAAFLARRAFLYRQAGRPSAFSKKIRSCLTAALKLASRNGCRETMQMIDLFEKLTPSVKVRSAVCDITPEWVEGVILVEAGILAPPVADVGTKRRSGAPPRRGRKIPLPEAGSEADAPESPPKPKRPMQRELF